MSEIENAVPVVENKPKRGRPKKATKTTTPAVPVRHTIEELHAIAPEKMTDAERIRYIKAQRESITGLVNKNTELEVSCKNAFAQYKNADEAYKNLRTALNSKFAEMEMQLRCYASNMRRMIEEGVKH